MQIIFKQDNISLALVTANDLDFSQFTNWSKNRPPDEVRVAQLVEFYKNNNIALVPGVVYCWRGPPHQVYDGIHRLLAAQRFVESGTAPKMQMLIQFRKSRKEQDIIDDFVNVNKSVNVPTIYIENTDALKKAVCLSIAEQLCKLYPAFVSPSRKPYVYNFNRDNLIEFISTWSINFSKPGVQDLAVQELLKLNKEAKSYVQQMGIPFPKKCSFHDFFLFYLDKSRIQSQMEMILQ